ncbi:MAG: hypothetical protein HYW50_05050, partial [Candidatus Diapherotrites archaeon]|nr:hypothetical protein [Candidatus Diapherotrites archaeon]
MKNFKVYGFLALLSAFFVFSGFALAVPGIPHQFKGTVTVNGSPAPDGTLVDAKIESSTYRTATVGGVYGMDPAETFFAQDPNGNRSGKTIEFFVDGIAAGTQTFINGELTELNLSVTKEVPPAPEPPPGGGSPPSSGGPDGGSPGGGVPAGGGTGGETTTNLLKIDKT